MLSCNLYYKRLALIDQGERIELNRAESGSGTPQVLNCQTDQSGKEDIAGKREGKGGREGG